MKRLNNGQLVPSHAELYRDLHKIQDDLVMEIFNQLGWQYYRRGMFRNKITRYKIKLEQYNWDILVDIEETPEKLLLKNDGYFWQLHIEYKSSVEEWGKQFNEMARQINNRKNDYGIPILISFDEEFKAFEKASDMAGFHLVVLPRMLLKKLGN